MLTFVEIENSSSHFPIMCKHNSCYTLKQLQEFTLVDWKEVVFIFQRGSFSRRPILSSIRHNEICSERLLH